MFFMSIIYHSVNTMYLKTLLVFNFLLLTSLADYDINNKFFPDDFMFGTASASYQIEGAWNEDGKGENIWDRFVHTHPEMIVDNSTGDVACDSYHKIKEDVALLKDLAVDHYRFSLSWSRILPNGTSDYINEAGVTYYKNLIKELKNNGITPFITLYHWDLPQVLEEKGGWLDEFMVEMFADYARTCFQLFGDDVKYWLTFNEQKTFCINGYGLGQLAPGVKSDGIGIYQCAHTLLKAHARAWHIYDEEFRATQKGKISTVIDAGWLEPETNSIADKIAAETKHQFSLGWFANPIIKGDYPEIMKTRIAERSAKEGYNKSRLPTFTEEEIAYIKGTYDYLGLNTYTVALIKAIEEPEIGTPSYDNDAGVLEYQPDHWESSASDWLKVAPWGIRKLLNYIKHNYNDPEIIVTENGFSDDGSSLNDWKRISYYQRCLSNIRDAIEDGVKVKGYTAWCFMDNFEWLQGYTQRFGLYFVDFTSADRTRIPKSSVDYYRNVSKTHCLVDSCV